MEGLHIWFRESKNSSSSFKLRTVMLNGGSQNFDVVALKPWTEYLFFLIPFLHEIEGSPSNSLTAITLQSCMHLHSLCALLETRLMWRMSAVYWQHPACPQKKWQSRGSTIPQPFCDGGLRLSPPSTAFWSTTRSGILPLYFAVESIAAFSSALFFGSGTGFCGTVFAHFHRVQTENKVPFPTINIFKWP